MQLAYPSFRCVLPAPFSSLWPRSGEAHQGGGSHSPPSGRPALVLVLVLALALALALALRRGRRRRRR